MNICVVEDEKVWRNKIQEIIEKYCMENNILFQIHLCSNGTDFMKKGMIDMLVVGADRIAANGDAANKIGTYTVAIAAKYTF